MKKKPKRAAAAARRKARTLAYPAEFRLRVVRLSLEEGCSTAMLCEQFGVSHHSVQRWVKAYRLHGAEGLVPRGPAGGKRRIADVLKRFFLMRTSPSTVHKTLSERGWWRRPAAGRRKTPPSLGSSNAPGPISCGRATS